MSSDQDFEESRDKVNLKADKFLSLGNSKKLLNDINMSERRKRAYSSEHDLVNLCE